MTNHSRVDPRQVTEFLRDSTVQRSISPGQRTGMEKRVLTAKWTVNERIVYDAVLDGYTSMDSLPVATGLSDADIRASAAKLVGRGIITNIAIDGLDRVPSRL